VTTRRYLFVNIWW